MKERGLEARVGLELKQGQDCKQREEGETCTASAYLLQGELSPGREGRAATASHCQAERPGAGYHPCHLARGPGCRTQPTAVQLEGPDTRLNCSSLWGLCLQVRLTALLSSPCTLLLSIPHLRAQTGFAQGGILVSYISTWTQPSLPVPDQDLHDYSSWDLRMHLRVTSLREFLLKERGWRLL